MSTLSLLRNAAGPGVGEIFVESKTVPANPFLRVTVMVDVLVPAPGPRVRKVGSASMRKSCPKTFTDTSTELIITGEPPDPSTVTK